jgi:hypothetical protein
VQPPLYISEQNNKIFNVELNGTEAFGDHFCLTLQFGVLVVVVIACVTAVPLAPETAVKGDSGELHDLEGQETLYYLLRKILDEKQAKADLFGFGGYGTYRAYRAPGYQSARLRSSRGGSDSIKGRKKSLKKAKKELDF